MFNLTAYEEGFEIGIEKGQYNLLIKLLTKKLGCSLSDKYLNILEGLESKKILNIALNIFDIYTLDDLKKYLS